MCLSVVSLESSPDIPPRNPLLSNYKDPQIAAGASVHYPHILFAARPSHCTGVSALQGAWTKRDGLNHRTYVDSIGR